MHTFAGVKVLEDGTVRAAPHLVDLPDFSGQTAADKGPVVFDYRREDGVLRWQIALPVGVIGRLIPRWTRNRAAGRLQFDHRRNLKSQGLPLGKREFPDP